MGDEAHIQHGVDWVFEDGRKLKKTFVNEFVDRIEYLNRDNQVEIGRIIRKPSASAWLVELASGRQTRVQHVPGCGCSGAPAVDWNLG